MSDPSTTDTERHNPESWKPHSLEYDSLGGGTIRNHLAIAHRDAWDARAIHIPVGRDGVVA